MAAEAGGMHRAGRRRRVATSAADVAAAVVAGDTGTLRPAQPWDTGSASHTLAATPVTGRRCRRFTRNSRAIRAAS